MITLHADGQMEHACCTLLRNYMYISELCHSEQSRFTVTTRLQAADGLLVAALAY
jgi:hypothetical protein